MESHQLTNDDNGPTILVVEGVEETRDGIENLLRADGYRVDPARTEGDAVARSQRQRPDLILVSLGGRPEAEVVAAACRVRQHAGLSENVPVVIFCVGTIAEGAEVEFERNVYGTRPDNFDQLRGFLGRLLCRLHTAP